MTNRQTPHQVLKSIWGFDQFRASQDAIVQALCNQNDALIVMPTGGGKSICFQVPGLVLPGLTIVISPLVALMENQVQAIVSKGVPAALLHSQLNRSERQKITYAIETQRLKLLYLSPETLLSQGVMAQLLNPELKISSLILDEAHCLVQWGDTFRPIYQQLGTVRDRLLAVRPNGTKINVAAFTATANPVEQMTIIQVLNLNNSIQFIELPYRSNLILKKQRVWTPHDRRQKLLKFIQSQNQTSGIVYVRTRNHSEELAQWLRSQTIQTASYHAGLVTSKKRDIEKDWMENRLTCVVATSAFGMGVDKPDVRWVVQYQPPLWLSEYVQEIGRAGRDGVQATGLTLVSERSGLLDPLDSTTWKRSIQTMHQKMKTRWSTTDRRSSAGIAHLELLKSIPKRSEVEQYINHRGCRWNYIQNFFGNLNLIKPCGHCDRCEINISKMRSPHIKQ